MQNLVFSYGILVNCGYPVCIPALLCVSSVTHRTYCISCTHYEPITSERDGTIVYVKGRLGLACLLPVGDFL